MLREALRYTSSQQVRAYQGPCSTSQDRCHYSADTPIHLPTHYGQALESAAQPRISHYPSYGALLRAGLSVYPLQHQQQNPLLHWFGSRTHSVDTHRQRPVHQTLAADSACAGRASVAELAHHKRQGMHRPYIAVRARL